MPWTKSDYPDAMKNLSTEDRNKAIDIANSLLKEGYEEGRAISIAIATAKDRGNGSGDSEYHVLPHPNGWSVRKTDAEQASFTFDTKEKALEKAKDLLHNKGGRLVIHTKEGDIQEHREY
ncbi:DUF2188 domain-containing protein [Legionella impletisoli]|uniref:DUF2188 domain-containing protein n=1 Tax=Legionella impletisoli TaxID=343510 RepID=A0A917JZU3_9GAMM|nr:DUF2188 domain-containing protein [Legionella impletisoli]GGI92453.1 hypothetical protein GCM10007966_21390 [Legionella impletisoli]